MTSREERDLRRRLARPDEVSDEILASQEGREARFIVQQRLSKTARQQKLACLSKKFNRKRK